ncbi:PQQ-binding-like beta-propeller repeat protein [Edaphobacter aggregans]|uniref:outer membrane protein assembly factor BamB family protein n=1 Tax=Edaphobacter aggregans TaxID=570835 RepID=UPI00163AB77C|nr:PQQ-binding-like beta-propeller repeat protein [Edaphobacter aggregans]
MIRRQDEPIVSGRGNPVDWLIDSRVALFNPAMSFAIATLYWEHLIKQIPFQLCCVEMTGIPLMTAIQAFAFRNGHTVNGFVIRKEQKESGRRRQIEGTINELPIIFLDDIVNRGHSVIRAQIALDKLGRKITQVVALIDFGKSDASERLLRDGIHLKSIIALDELGVRRSSSSDIRQEEEHQIFRELWRLDPGDRRSADVVPKSTPAFDHDCVYHGADSGSFCSIDASTGDVRWRFSAGTDKNKGIRSSPLLHEDLVYFGAYDGVFYAIERMTGEMRWQFIEADWIGSSACCAPTIQRLFVGLEHATSNSRGSLVALETRTGEKSWELPMAGFVHAGPCFIEALGCVIVGNDQGEVCCADALTGTLRWRVRAAGPIKAKACYDEKTRLIIAGSFDKNVYAWRVDTGELAWKTSTEALIYSEPLLVQNLVYVCSTDKHLHILNAVDGTHVMKYSAGAKLFASPSQSNSRIYFASTAGAIFEFDPQTRSVVGTHLIPEKIVNKVVCDERTGRFYVTAIDGQLFAFERR